jgi:hypothetical protein
MAKLAIILAGLLFIAAGIIVLFSGNWQSALFLFAIGIAFVIFFFRG